jgi:hypothetical protein
MPISASDIHEGQFYVRGWPRLVIHVFGDSITYLDPWGPGRCGRGTFAKWADRIMSANDEIKFSDDIKRIRTFQADLTGEQTTNKIRLVVENDPARLAANHVRANDDRQRDHAARTLRRLAVNLLRVIAGAGEPDRLPRDLRDAFAAWAEFAEADHNTLAGTPGVNELTIDHLFLDNESEPQNEEEWERWAEANPRRDYVEQSEWIMRDLRRAILREIAAIIDGSQVQISRRERDVQSALNRLERARDEYFSDQRRQRIADAAVASQRQQRKTDQPIAHVRASKPTLDPVRQAKAEKEIAKLREVERDNMIANLNTYQWAGLRAVQSADPGAFESVNAFTLDVLGSMKLIKRKPGSKSKRDWQLTDLGMLALSRDPAAD